MPGGNLRPRTRRRLPQPNWLDGLAPEDQARVKRWVAEVGPKGFDRIVTSYADAPRAKGRSEIDDTPFLREMARLRLQHPGWAPHRLAKHVANRVTATGDWGDRPVRVAAHSLCEKLKRDFSWRSVELMREARAEVRQRTRPHAGIAPTASGWSGSSSGHPSARGGLSLAARNIDAAVRSVQRTLEHVPPWLRDEEFWRQLDLSDREATLRAIPAEPLAVRIAEEAEHLHPASSPMGR
jgi:hypothetical protein